MNTQNAILLCISLASVVVNMTVSNKVAKAYIQTQSDNLLFSLYNRIVTTLVLMIYARTFYLHPVTLLLAAAFAFVSVVCSVMHILAYKNGPMSLTTLISSGGSLIISSLAGILFFGESVTPVQVAGIILILLVIYLFSDVKQGGNGNIQPLWIPVIILAAVLNGGQGIIQKMQGATSYTDEKPVFLLYTFLIGVFLIAIWLWLNMNTGKKEPVTLEKPSVLIGPAVISGVCIAVVNVINLKLAIEVPAPIFFPLYCGGSIIFSTLVSSLVFKEKLTTKQKISFVIGFVAIFMVADIIG